MPVDEKVNSTKDIRQWWKNDECRQKKVDEDENTIRYDNHWQKIPWTTWKGGERMTLRPQQRWREEDWCIEPIDRLSLEEMGTRKEPHGSGHGTDDWKRMWMHPRPIDEGRECTQDWFMKFFMLLRMRLLTAGDVDEIWRCPLEICKWMGTDITVNGDEDWKKWKRAGNDDPQDAYGSKDTGQRKGDILPMCKAVQGQWQCTKNKRHWAKIERHWAKKR